MIRRYSRVFAVITTCMTLTILTMAGCGGGSSPTKPTPTPPSPPTPPPTPVATSISISPSSHTLAAIGATVRLTATVRDQNNNPMTGQAVTWTSANTAVATVSAQGLVTAVANGTAQITARSGNASGNAAITVAEPVPTRITITPSSHTLEAIGATIQLSAAVRDQRNNVMSGQTVTWSSGDEAVATVSEGGLVTAVSNGMVDITAQSGSLSASATITVSEPVPTTIAIDPESATLEAIGQTVQLMAVVLDQRENAMQDETVMWSSGDELVATVNEDGLVTAVGNGMADIMAQTGDVTGSATITVSQVPASIGIEVDPESTTLTEFGETLQLLASVSDANEETIEEPAINWSSSDETVVTVDETGLVTAVGNGMTDITAQAGDLSDMVSITVMGPSPDREALIDIYNATDGMSWMMQDNWSSDEHVSTWYGVMTDVQGRVTSLNLEDNGLSGNIPSELGQLGQLEMLNLASNKLEGELPEELGNLTNIKAMYLQNNADLTGKLPDTFLGLSLMALNLEGTIVCVPQNPAFQMWLSGIMDAQGITLCEIEYVLWPGVKVYPGILEFEVPGAGAIPLSTCFPGLDNYEAFGAVITVHYSIWQGRADMDSPWMDIAGTRKIFEVCPYKADVPGDYRLVGDVTIDGERRFRASENYFTIP